jgi:hypothetical protein
LDFSNPGARPALCGICFFGDDPSVRIPFYGKQDGHLYRIDLMSQPRLPANIYSAIRRGWLDLKRQNPKVRNPVTFKGENHGNSKDD